MSQVLTVPTHFTDIGELSEGFLDRVEQDTLILYGPVAYEDGSEIEFAVLLADGTTALEGTGVSALLSTAAPIAFRKLATTSSSKRWSSTVATKSCSSASCLRARRCPSLRCLILKRMNPPARSTLHPRRTTQPTSRALTIPQPRRRTLRE